MVVVYSLLVICLSIFVLVVFVLSSTLYVKIVYGGLMLVLAVFIISAIITSKRRKK